MCSGIATCRQYTDQSAQNITHETSNTNHHVLLKIFVLVHVSFIVNIHSICRKDRFFIRNWFVKTCSFETPMPLAISGASSNRLSEMLSWIYSDNVYTVAPVFGRPQRTLSSRLSGSHLNLFFHFKTGDNWGTQSLKVLIVSATVPAADKLSFSTYSITARRLILFMFRGLEKRFHLFEGTLWTTWHDDFQFST